jgi:hypothetical protein
VRAGIWAVCWMLLQVQTNSLNMTSNLLQKESQNEATRLKGAGFLLPSKIPSAKFDGEREVRDRANL